MTIPALRRLALLAAAACAPVVWHQTGAGATSPPVFEDVARGAGLTVPHISSPEKRYIIESMSGGVGMIDYDADGDLDLVTVNGSNVERHRAGGDPLVTLYRQDAPLRFTNVTADAGLHRRGWGMGVAAGDFDNDGAPDLYVTGYGANALYRNRGDGTFEDVTDRAGVAVGGFSAGAAWGDYDRDGWIDLFVARYVSVDIDNLPEFGRDEFCRFRGIYVQCGPVGLPGESDFLFRNRGDGTFEDVSARAGVSDESEYFGLGAIWGDVDDDGWLDLFVANDMKPNYLYRNRRDGTFEDVSLISGTAMSGEGAPQGCMGIDFGDYDRDGRPDLFVTNFSHQPNALYRNLGPAGFADVGWDTKVGLPSFFLVGWGADFLDYDNDGWPDLFVANGHVYPQADQAGASSRYLQPMLLHRNLRDGRFADAAAGAGLGSLPLASRRGSATGDVDGDGDLDLFVLNVGEPPSLLINRGADGHRVLFRLVARRSNRSAIGARVTITAGGLRQVDQVFGGSSYLSQNDLRLHFGLGGAATIDSVEVRWPDGAVERLTGVAADRVHTILEGEGLVESSPLGERTVADGR